VSGDHTHASAVTAAGRHQRPLAIALALTAAYMVVEAVAGVAFSSLALLSDAAHMLTDVGGLGMALAAIQFGKSRRSRSHTYGLYRLEVLAALVNAVLLFAVAAFVLVEAYRRLTEPPEVPGTPLLVVAGIGMLVNLVSFRLLRAGAGESLNVKGAYLEVMSDMLGSAGVILAGVILLTTGWSYADPLIGAAIGVFILPRTWRLGREALRILLEVAPSDVDIVALEAELAARPGVGSVHDLHVWTLTSGLRAASGHVVLSDGADLGAVLAGATEVLEHRYSIQHVTLQCEPPRYRESPQEV
jgi:cobalt-zinc-cadmium efflux system protein